MDTLQLRLVLSHFKGGQKTGASTHCLKQHLQHPPIIQSGFSPTAGAWIARPEGDAERWTNVGRMRCSNTGLSASEVPRRNRQTGLWLVGLLVLSACTGDGTSLTTPAQFDEVDIALDRPCRADGFAPRLLTEFAPLSLHPLLEAPDNEFFETSSPTAVVFDTENNMIVARRNGVIESHSDGRVAILADLSDDTPTVADQGVLALEWLGDTQLLVLRTAASGATVLVVVNIDGDPAAAPGPIELLRVDQPDARHNGGGLAVDRATGEVYIGIGDGGKQGDPDGQAGDATNKLGTVLRGTVDLAGQGLVPTQGRPSLVWAIGLRNPHRIWLENETLWLTDVGENCREELNRLDINEVSYDLGWNAWEGDVEFVANDTRETTSPLLTYGHAQGRCAIIGGVGLPASFNLPGAVAVADFCSGEVFAVDSNGIIGVLPIQVTKPVDLSVSPDDKLIITSLDGSIQAVTHTL